MGALASRNGSRMDGAPWRAACALFVLSAGLVPARAQAPPPCSGFDVAYLDLGPPAEGDVVVDLEYTPDGARLVVANLESRNLVVMDADDGTVLRVIGLSGGPEQLALTPDGLFAVVTLFEEDALSIVRLGSGTEVAVVPIGLEPGPVLVDASGSLAVVGNTGENTLSIVDLATRTELRRIGPARFTPVTAASSWSNTRIWSGFALTPDGTTALVPDLQGDRLMFLDVAGGPTTFLALDDPYDVALSANGVTAVCSAHFPATQAYVVDVPTRTLAATVPTGQLATFSPPIVVNAAGTRAFVAVRNGVVSVDVATGVASNRLFSTNWVRALELTFDDAFLVAATEEGHVVDALSGSVAALVREGPAPEFVAVSPTERRAALAEPSFEDLIELWSVDGALSTLLAYVPSGPAPEADRAKRVRASADGTAAVVINRTSRTLSIVDTSGTTGAVLATVALDPAPAEVALAPDGSTAVVTHLGSEDLALVDLASSAVLRVSLTGPTGDVLVSADSQTAWVLELDDALMSGSGLWRVALPGGALTAPRLTLGEAGGGGYSWEELSGLAASPDQSRLVVCNGGSDDVSVVDALSWTELARLPVAPYPVRCAFTPDGARALVVSRNGPLLTEVLLPNGLPPSVGRTLVLGLQPLDVAVAPNGLRAAVGCYGAQRIDLVDLATFTLVASVDLVTPENRGQPIGLAWVEGGAALLVCTRGGGLSRIDAATLLVTDSVRLRAEPADLAWSEATGTALVASPRNEDGLFVARPYAECGRAFCFGNGGVSPGCTLCPCGNDALATSSSGCLNQGGSGATLASAGRPRLTDESLRFALDGAAPGGFAVLVSGANALPQAGPCPPGSGLSGSALDGLRCVGGGLVRHGARAVDPAGAVGTTTPGWGEGAATLLDAFAPGETRRFQAIYRVNPANGCGSGQNSSNAIELTIAP